jgi:hypothetical protein
MSPRSARWAARWRGFLLLEGTEPFFRRFAFLLYPYCLYWLWTVDWRFYAALAPYAYEPIGLARVVGLPFPGAEALLLCKVAATAAAAACLLGVRRRVLTAPFLSCTMLSDAWHNMFGFVNAQIHLVWFCGLMVLAGHPADARSGPASWRSGVAFRCMELVTVLVYVQAGIAKLRAGGLAWALTGTTTQIGMVRQGVPAGVFLADFGALMPVLASASLLMELSFVLYYPLPRCRRLLLAMAVTFHLGTWVAMGIDFSHLYIFSASALVLAPRLLGGGLTRPWLARTLRRGLAWLPARASIPPLRARIPAPARDQG